MSGLPILAKAEPSIVLWKFHGLALESRKVYFIRGSLVIVSCFSQRLALTTLLIVLPSFVLAEPNPSYSEFYRLPLNGNQAYNEVANRLNQTMEEYRLEALSYTWKNQAGEQLTDRVSTVLGVSGCACKNAMASRLMIDGIPNAAIENTAQLVRETAGIKHVATALYMTGGEVYVMDSVTGFQPLESWIFPNTSSTVWVRSTWNQSMSLNGGDEQAVVSFDMFSSRDELLTQLGDAIGEATNDFPRPNYLAESTVKYHLMFQEYMAKGAEVLDQIHTGSLGDSPANIMDHFYRNELANRYKIGVPPQTRAGLLQMRTNWFERVQGFAAKYRELAWKRAGYIYKKVLKICN